MDDFDDFETKFGGARFKDSETPEAARLSNLSWLYDYTPSRFIRPRSSFIRTPFDESFSSKDGHRNLILSAYDHSCLRCEGCKTLQIDHFGVPKIRGGNFILCTQDESGELVPNIAVLCSRCNMAKGAMTPFEFLNETQIRRAMTVQRSLLIKLMRNEETRNRIVEYYRVARMG